MGCEGNTLRNPRARKKGPHSLGTAQARMSSANIRDDPANIIVISFDAKDNGINNDTESQCIVHEANHIEAKHGKEVELKNVKDMANRQEPTKNVGVVLLMQADSDPGSVCVCSLKEMWIRGCRRWCLGKG